MTEWLFIAELHFRQLLCCNPLIYSFLLGQPQDGTGGMFHLLRLQSPPHLPGAPVKLLTLPCLHKGWGGFEMALALRQTHLLAKLNTLCTPCLITSEYLPGF